MLFDLQQGCQQAADDTSDDQPGHPAERSVYAARTGILSVDPAGCCPGKDDQDGEKIIDAIKAIDQQAIHFFATPVCISANEANATVAVQPRQWRF